MTPDEPEPPEALGPPYPVVLAHGFFGFEDFAGLGFINYFYGIVDHLAAQGEVDVFTPSVDPFNDSTTRGLQLLEEVEAIVADTGYEKVNLIGHSQGGLDARVVAHLRPDLVASVTTISSPHHGTEVADIVLGIVPSSRVQALVDELVEIVGGPLWGDIDEDTSIAASLQQMSSPGMAAFNAEYPNAPGVLYFSIAGRSDRHLGTQECQSPDTPEFLAAYATGRDPIDPLMMVSESMVQGSSNYPIANDGLVNVPKAKWGTFLGCIPADHFDEIGHLFGDGPGDANPYEHRGFYLELVGFLRDRGL